MDGLLYARNVDKTIIKTESGDSISVLGFYQYYSKSEIVQNFVFPVSTQKPLVIKPKPKHF